MYFFVLIFLSIAAVIGSFNKKIDKILFAIEGIVLTVMLCFRYGQGTDWFGYKILYLKKHAWGMYESNIHGEFLWQLFEGIFRGLGLPYEAFTFLIALLTMLLTLLGIRRYSEICTLSLLILYPGYYMTFFMSGIRSGLVLAAVLGIIIPIYIESSGASGKIAYILVTLVLAMIHSSALILLLPMVRIKKMEKYFLPLASLFGITSAVFFVFIYPEGIPILKGNYTLLFTPSLPAVAVRVFLYIIIFFMHRGLEKRDDICDKLYYMYYLGFCVYVALWPMAFFAHRISLYLKVVEVILIPILLSRANTIKIYKYNPVFAKKMICCLVIMCCMTEGIKNINSYIYQANYINGIYFYNYPWINVFNAEEIYKRQYINDAVVRDSAIIEN